MKTLYEGILADNVIKESVLSDMEDTIKIGDEQADVMKHLYAVSPLVGIAGVGDSTEKLFTNELDKFHQEEWKSPRMYESDLKHKDRRYPNCQHFGKWLERLTIDELHTSFNITSIAEAEELAKKIEKYAKKVGVLKNMRNIVMIGKYFNDSKYFTRGQLQLYVQKVDKEGEVVRTKHGKTDILYLFDCK